MTSRNWPASAHCSKSSASSCPRCHFFSAKHRSISSESAATPGKTWENFPFGFKILFHVTHITLVLKDPESIHLPLHCFLNECHEGLMNDCDEEDTPRTAEKMSNTKLKEEQNTRFNSVCYRKGEKIQHTSRDLSYQQIRLALSLIERQYAHENSCCFATRTHTRISLLKFCHSSSIKAATLTRVIHPLYIYSTSVIISLFLWVISWDMFPPASCDYSWEL